MYSLDIKITDRTEHINKFYEFCRDIVHTRVNSKSIKSLKFWKLYNFEDNGTFLVTQIMQKKLLVLSPKGTKIPQKTWTFDFTFYSQKL